MLRRSLRTFVRSPSDAHARVEEGDEQATGPAPNVERRLASLELSVEGELGSAINVERRPPLRDHAVMPGLWGRTEILKHHLGSEGSPSLRRTQVRSVLTAWGEATVLPPSRSQRRRRDSNTRGAV